MSRSLLIALAANTLLAAPAFAETIAITNAKIETAGAAGEIALGTVVIVNGQIASVGAGATVPAGAQIIDAKGGVATPGLIAATTNLGLSEVEGLRDTRDEFAGSEIGAAFDVSYGINPASTMIPLARQSGVTRAVATPTGGRGFGGDQDEIVADTFTAGSDSKSVGASLFAGQAAALTTAANVPDPVFKTRMAMVVDLGSAGAQVAGSRGASFVLLKSALADARLYKRNRSMFERGAEIPSHLTREDLEALLPVTEGRTPLLIRVRRASDIRQVLKLAREEKLKIILEGCEEGWLVAAELAAANVPVLIDTEADLPDQFESLGAHLDNAARLQAAGVLIGIEGSHDFNNLRQARFNAGTAVANGLSYPAAIKALTVNMARIFDLPQTGALEVGKAADVVIWSGDPLETTTYPTAVFIDGKAQPMTSRGLELRDRYAAHPNDGLPPAYH